MIRIFNTYIDTFDDSFASVVGTVSNNVRLGSGSSSDKLGEFLNLILKTSCATSIAAAYTFSRVVLYNI